MLIYSYKLEKYILSHFFPKILLIPDSYVIKGSFRRKVPYVTDVDVVNKVFHKYNKSNIYTNLIHLIETAYSDNDIIVVQITCGIDERFKIINADDEEINRIKKLLSSEEILELDKIIEENKEDNEKKKFFINELIWPLYKLRWTPYEVLNNSIELRGDHSISFEETVENNTTILIQYYLKIGTNLLGVDVVIQYEEIKEEKKIYAEAAKYYLKLSNYKKEYYYMLFPLKNYFRTNKNDIYTELDDIIEKKMGLYKQLMVRIDSYRMLYLTNNLDYNMGKNIVVNLINDIPKLLDFNTNILEKIKQVLVKGDTNDNESKLEQWNILLESLYSQINDAASQMAKKYFYSYLDKIPENKKKEYYIDFVAEAQRKMFSEMSKYMTLFL
jgi:hypothetical protein